MTMAILQIFIGFATFTTIYRKGNLSAEIVHLPVIRNLRACRISSLHTLCSSHSLVGASYRRLGKYQPFHVQTSLKSESIFLGLVNETLCLSLCSCKCYVNVAFYLTSVYL